MHVHTVLHSDTIETDEVLEDGKIRGVLGNRDFIIACTLALRAVALFTASPYDINRTADLRQKHSVVQKRDAWGPRGSSAGRSQCGTANGPIVTITGIQKLIIRVSLGGIIDEQ